MKKRGLVAVNCANFGASCVYGLDDGSVERIQPVLEQSVVSPFGWQTLVHSLDEETGHPYRVDLAVPRPIARNRPATPLFHENSSVCEFEAWTPGFVEHLCNAVSFLVWQTSKSTIHHCGVVVPDRLSLENAELFLKQARIARNRIILLPWPVAAAWTWIDRYEMEISQELSLDSQHAGSILCVQIGRDDLASVAIHVIESGDAEPREFVPARNRDRDDLIVKKADTREIKNHLELQVGELSDCVGVVLCGRVANGNVAQEIESKVRTFCDQRSLRLVCEAEFEHGLLTNGALSATMVVCRNGVPYYETIPQIELLVNKPILEDRPKPLLTVLKKGWLDCLYGVKGAIEIAGGTMIPANKQLKHRPEYPNLSLQTGETMITIAFDGRDVREVCAVTDNSSMKRERGLSLQVEYQLGSGRPKVTVERARHPNQPLVFNWEYAKEIEVLRDEITPYTAADLDRFHEQRQLRRESQGMQRY